MPAARPVANEERSDVNPSVMKVPRPPKSPVNGVDPLLEVEPVGVVSPGKVRLGSGNCDAIALPAEARTLESTEALDTTTEERTGINPSGSRGLNASLISSLDLIVVGVVVAVIVGAKVSLRPRPAAEVAEATVVVDDVATSNSSIPVPKFEVLNCALSNQYDTRIDIVQDCNE